MHLMIPSRISLEISLKNNDEYRFFSSKFPHFIQILDGKTKKIIKVPTTFSLRQHQYTHLNDSLLKFLNILQSGCSNNLNAIEQ